MEPTPSELVAVRLDAGWFLSLRCGDPAEGLMVSEDTVRLIHAATGLLSACQTARRALTALDVSDQPPEAIAALRDCATVQLDVALELAENGPPGMAD